MAFGHVFDVATNTNRLNDIQSDQPLEVTVGRVIDDMETGAAPAVGHETLCNDLCQNELLSIIELSLDRWVIGPLTPVGTFSRS